MIQSAMMFALGVFVSGLAWLALTVALVRRTRRLTVKRLLSGIAVRRAEFVAERDELRARHAVEMYRVENEVSRVLDLATAHRLEADVTERDLISARAELAARLEDLQDHERRLSEQREQLQEIERRRAEAGTVLRATQHQLSLELKRRAIAEGALDEAGVLAEEQRAEINTLRAENEALRATLDKEPDGDDVIPRIPLSAAPVPVVLPPPVAVDAEPALGSVVPLPTRPRPTAEPSALAPAIAVEAARDRIGGDGKTPRRARARAAAEPSEPTIVAELGSRRSAGNGGDAPEPRPDADDKAETRFFEALAEIRALKRSATPAGE
jgi:hypothetical protein